jgi:hypothetical protein
MCACAAQKNRTVAPTRHVTYCCKSEGKQTKLKEAFAKGIKKKEILYLLKFASAVKADEALLVEVLTLRDQIRARDLLAAGLTGVLRLFG